MVTVRLDVTPRFVRRLAAVLGLIDVAFVVGMVAFIHYWARIDQFGPRGRLFVRYYLIQFHLGSENVLAAWYSSMLLLGVALAAVMAWTLDRGRWRLTRDRWLSAGWLVFAALFTVLSLDELGSLHERIGMMVALNKASLAPHATAPVGWVYMLAIPIGVVAIFMFAFAWLRLREAPLAFALIATGIALYLSDPVLEMVEGALVKSGSGRLLLERILEEGVAELGGTLCFLLGVLLYLARRGSDASGVVTVERRTAARWAAGAGLLMTTAIPAAHWFVNHLPAGDSGIPDNWFPAAALALLAALLLTVHGRRAVGPAAIAIALSAYFGAGLFIYAAGYRAAGRPGVLIDMLATAAAAAVSVMVLVRAQHSALGSRHPALSTEH